MAVMAAKVALAGNGRAVRGGGLLRNRQGVKFGAKHHRGAGLATVEHRRHTMTAKAGHQPIG